MNRRLVRTVCLSALFALFGACSSTSTEAPPNTNFGGKWSGAAYKTGSANPSFSLDLEQSGDAVHGTITSGDGTFQAAELEDVHIEADGGLIFRARANGGSQFKDHLFLFDAHRKDDTLQGTWTDILQGAQGPFTLYAGPGH
ncbi:MAG: hypothetical protein PVF51_01390 [Nitrospirota bacterium]|jgi:hypothetical protein